MRTPAGKECRYYYEDFHRGRSLQECRLIQANPASPPWRPRDCFNCTVPAILLANGSPHLVLRGTVRQGFLGLVGRRVEVRAFCSKHQIPIEDPYVGCPLCNAELGDIANLLSPSGD